MSQHFLTDDVMTVWNHLSTLLWYVGRVGGGLDLPPPLHCILSSYSCILSILPLALFRLRNKWAMLCNSPPPTPRFIQIPTLLELPPSVTIPPPFQPGSHHPSSHSLQKFPCFRNVSDNHDYSFEYVDRLVIQHGLIISPHFIDKDWQKKKGRHSLTDGLSPPGGGGGGTPLYKPGMCGPKGYGFSTVSVWKRVWSLHILLWNRVWFCRGNYGIVVTYLSFQFQMNKKEKVIYEFEIDFKKSFCWRSNQSK